MNATDFRTCPVTARRIHRPAETLVKANAVVAVVSLLIGAIAGAMILGPWRILKFVGNSAMLFKVFNIAKQLLGK